MLTPRCACGLPWRRGTPAASGRFLYCGAAGSWTPLHADVLRSHSWSVNVCGTKRWLLFPPSQTPRLRGLYDVLAETSAAPWQRAATVVEVVQHAGDAIFVPSGWRHQVRARLGRQRGLPHV